MKTALYVCVFCLWIILNPVLTRPEENTVSEKAIDVRTFMKNPEQYAGSVTIQGVVSRIFPKDKMIALIDIQEVKECRVITCANLTLPVKWSGDMPEPAETVQISGRIEKEDNKMIFIALTLVNISGKHQRETINEDGFACFR